MERDQRPKQKESRPVEACRGNTRLTGDGFPRRRDPHSHRTRVRNEVERRINTSKYVYARYHILLPFFRRHPDALRRARAVAQASGGNARPQRNPCE